MGLKDDLLLCEAYPQPRPTTVELVETHISWVFLADDDVYKVKKPVDLGFLDFRTLEQRKDACEAEIRLNARLAPDMYVGVVPVRQQVNGRFAIGGEGLVVDWAVHMVRIPDACRTDILLKQNELSNEQIDAIAKRIADFHSIARSDIGTSRLGSPEAIATNIQENFAQTQDVIAQYIDREQANQISHWQTSFLSTHRRLFEERMANGFVRDGHGDLRLEHIYLVADRSPAIIDCIEFNERFRFADVCADIAFLSMDLTAHGRVDLAERLLACYAREANDFDLYALVDFYESYRAYVRGKISSMVACEWDVVASARAQAAADARLYFLLALSVDRTALLKPALVAVGGPIASGKSTIASRIGADMSAPVIDTDRTRKSMLGVAPTHAIHDSAWHGAYDPAFTDKVYAEVFRRAAVVLASGRPVVVDASFHSESMRKQVRDLAHRHDVPFRFVECRADEAVYRVRLLAREKERGVSDGRLEIFEDFCSKFEAVSELSTIEHIRLDTGRAIEENLTLLRERLDTWPSGFVK